MTLLFSTASAFRQRGDLAFGQRSDLAFRCAAIWLLGGAAL